MRPLWLLPCALWLACDQPTAAVDGSTVVEDLAAPPADLSELRDLASAVPDLALCAASGLSCAMDNDCPPGETCSGVCTAMTCAQDSDCRYAGLYCNGCRCVSVQGRSCTKNADCSSNGVCLKGQCDVGQWATCATDQDCSADGFASSGCFNRRCVGLCIGVSCGSAQQCGPGAECVSSCTDDSDCPTNDPKAKYCVPFFLAGASCVECRYDTQCTGGLSCINNFCR